MKKKIIKGDVFIIPNYAVKLADFSEQEWKEWIKDKLSRLAGIEAVGDKEKMIRLRITSDEYDNWQDRFARFQEIIGIREEDFKNSCKSSRESRLLGHFPSYFPSRIFEGVKEGDKVTLDCPEYGAIIELTCKQLGYRYNMFGLERFEDVFQSVLDRADCSI